MNTEQMKEQTQKILSQATGFIKEKAFKLTGIPSASVAELGAFIPSHPDTLKVTRTFLGRSFTFYNLETMGIHYYLEMKGPAILQLDVTMKERNIISYRSYKDRHKLNIPVSFP